MFDRSAELRRYEDCYLDPGYAMGAKRKAKAAEVLSRYAPGPLLDVGAGRGELREIAEAAGYVYQGVEPTSYLCGERITRGIATELPFADMSFDMVACLDVLEHLVPDDVEPALAEMGRVSRSRLFLTASEQSHRSQADGKDLHISKRPKLDWEFLFQRMFSHAKMEYLGMVGVSPGWMITKWP